MISLSNREARRFLLLKHGLLGSYRFSGKEGTLSYIRQTGCIQFDPVDSCGKNAELVLQSRIKGFRKETLESLLYEDRALLDYPDKNLSIMPVEDWQYFSRYRKAAEEGGLKFPELQELETQAIHYITERGAVSGDELPLSGEIFWHSHIHWSGNWGGKTNAARAVLEQLYSTGKLLIHHKKGSRKYYDLAEKHLSPEILYAPDPLPDDFEHQKWRVYRRIGAVGLLWDRPSDAWLNIWGLKAPERTEAFRQLTNEGKIFPVSVEGVSVPLYCQADDIDILDEARREDVYKPRCEALAPLDCLMWDRKLIKALFGFAYSWEIYTPEEKRKYGYYVLPLLYGERFIGRVEAVNERKSKVLLVKNIWYEEGVKQTKTLLQAVEGCLKRLSKFNGCKGTVFPENSVFESPVSENLIPDEGKI